MGGAKAASVVSYCMIVLCPPLQAYTLVDKRLHGLLLAAGLQRHVANIKSLFLIGDGALFHSFFERSREAMHTQAGSRYWRGFWCGNCFCCMLW